MGKGGDYIVGKDIYTYASARARFRGLAGDAVAAATYRLPATNDQPPAAS